MDFRRVTGYLHEGPKLQLRAFPSSFYGRKLIALPGQEKELNPKKKGRKSQVNNFCRGRIYKTEGGDASIGRVGASLFCHRR